MSARLHSGLLMAVLLFGVSGCERPQALDASGGGPPPDVARRAVESLLPGLQFGPDQALQTYREIRAVDVAGSHYAPDANRYAVHYCVEYTHFASDELAKRCDLNVQVYELDSKKWVGFASGIGTLYRWQLIETPAPEPKPEAAAPNAAAAPE